VQWWRQHPSETQEMIVAKLGIGPAEAAATYETFTRILTVTGDTKESSIRNYVKSQQPDRDVETDLALETIVNTRLLREVQAELGLDGGAERISFHCSDRAMIEGLAGERAIIEAIHAATGRPTITTASGVLAALQALNMRRIVLASPYVSRTNQLEVAYLREA